MKNCVNCGVALDDYAASCHVCGSAQPVANYQQPQMNYDQSQMGYQQPQMGYQQAQMGYQQPQAGYGQPYQQQQQPKPANKKGIIIALVVALIVVAGVIAAVLLLGKDGGKGGKKDSGFKNGTKEEVLDTYYNAMVEEDAETVVACLYSDGLLDAILEAENYTKDQLYDEVEAMYFESMYSDWEEVKNIEITDEEALDDDDIEYFNEIFYDQYDYECDIKEMYICDIDYEYYDGYYEEWEEDTDTLLIFKMEGAWYVSQW